MPGREYPEQDGIDTYVQDCLQGNSPISPAVIGASDTCDSRNDDGGYLYLAAFFHHKIAEEVCCGCGTEASDEETEELETCQLCQFRGIIKVGDERSTDEEYQIE